MEIWKFSLLLQPPSPGKAHYFTVHMPKGARVVSIGADNDGPRVWAEVDPGCEMRSYRFACVWTGKGHVPEGYDYDSSLVDPNNLIWHVYRDTSNPDGDAIVAGEERPDIDTNPREEPDPVRTKALEDFLNDVASSPDHPFAKHAAHLGLRVKALAPEGDGTEVRYTIVPIEGHGWD